MGWRRDGANRVPAIIVNVGKGIDTVTYFPAHLVYIYGASWDEAEKLSRPAPILKHFRMGPGEIRSWSHTKWGTPPTDLEQSRGPNAEVHIQTEMPEAVRATLEREAIAAEARRALKLLLQIPEDEWTDTQMRAIILNIAKSDPDLELPDTLLKA
jgi:hypothetical protein